MNRSHAAVTIALTLLLVTVPGAGLARAQGGEPPPSGTPTFNILTYGYYCTDGTTTCDAASGKLRYIGIEVYGQDNQHRGPVSQDGFFLECGRFFTDGGTAHYYHEFVWDKDHGIVSATRSTHSVQGFDKLNGFVPANIGDDTTNPSTSAIGQLNGSAGDPISNDQISVTGVQVANDDSHTLTNGQWKLQASGTIYESIPTSHQGTPVGTGTMSCTSNAHLFSTTPPTGGPPQYMAESTFEPYEFYGETNYPT
jgi:hypothetical protein